MEKNFIDEKIKETVKDTLIEYKKFAFKQDIKKVCFAVILASSFDKLVKNISNSLLMPFFNFLIDRTNGNWRDFKIQVIPGLNLEIGQAIGGVLDFLIISFLLFLILRMLAKQEKSLFKL